MPDGQNGGDLSDLVPCPIQPREPVIIDMDGDVLHWLRSQPRWQQELNDLCREYMESHLIREMAFEEGAASR